MAILLFCLPIIAVCVSAQSPWRSSPLISRVPGLRPVGDSMSYPEFLTMNMAYKDVTNQHNTCPDINPDCPRSCLKIDNRKCRICDCRELNEDRESEDCREPSLTCPQSCRKRDHVGCKICSCGDKATESRVLSTVYKTCSSMIMCMLSCHVGYKLSDVTDSHGCQTCNCINKNSEETGSYHHTWSTANNYNQGASTGSTHSNKWESETGSTLSSTGVGRSDVWGSNTDMHSSSSSCSGPMCQGEGDGFNPINPGGYKGRADSGSCSGPFCASSMGGGGASMMGGGDANMMGGGGAGMMGGGDANMMSGGGAGMMSGGGASQMGGGGTGKGGGGSSSSGCSGPFCISGSSGSGMGGGAGSGLMGGPGGGGAFSPFGLAASSRKSTSGCSGPFCKTETETKGDNTS